VTFCDKDSPSRSQGSNVFLDRNYTLSAEFIVKLILAANGGRIALCVPTAILIFPLIFPGRGIDMCITCNYVNSMARMIQVRNVPDALHRSLKARAAMAGMSLSDYLLGELREIAERPTLAEFRERLHKRKPLPLALDTSGLLREERTAR
jgi:antitoxin FitA